MNMTEGTQPTQRRFTHRMDRPINRPVRGSRSYVYPRDTRRAFGWRTVHSPLESGSFDFGHIHRQSGIAHPMSVETGKTYGATRRTRGKILVYRFENA